MLAPVTEAFVMVTLEAVGLEIVSVSTLLPPTTVEVDKLELLTASAFWDEPACGVPACVNWQPVNANDNKKTKSKYMSAA